MFFYFLLHMALDDPWGPKYHAERAWILDGDLRKAVTFSVILSCNIITFEACVETSIKNWIRSSPGSKLMFFEAGGVSNANVKEVMERTKTEYDYEFGPSLERDEEGIVYVDDWFVKSYELATTKMVCFISVDMFIPEDFGRTTEALYRRFAEKKRQFALTGRKCLVRWKPELTLEEMRNDFDKLVGLDEVSAAVNAPHSYGFVLISRNVNHINIDDIPPFHAELYFWDAWIVGWLDSASTVVSMGGKCGSYSVWKHPRSLLPLTGKLRDNANIARHSAVTMMNIQSITVTVEDVLSSRFQFNP